MSSIPEEVYRDILLRLPVKSILVCKCVCKDWYALITSSDFVSAHIAIQKNNPNILLLQAIDSNQLYQTYYDSLASSLFEFQRDFIKMDYPSEWTKSGYHVRLLGSCNGLLSMWLYDYNGNWPIPWNTACFWNPATRQYKLVTSQPPYAFQSKHVCMNAFAYDHKNDDYKLVVGLKPRQETKDCTLFQVYTLSSDSWTIGPTVPYRFSESDTGVLVNGDLHWLGCVILSLDISDVSFTEVHVPKEFSEKGKRMSSLGVLEGCLSVLVDLRKVGFEVWVMLDYGVLESWNKRYVIAKDSTIRNLFDPRIVWSFKNGQILLMNSLRLVLYDPKDGSVRELNTDLHDNDGAVDRILITNATNYFISLVSLNFGTYVGGKDESRINI